jgi:REP element-mobilizing transposase RayT
MIHCHRSVLMANHVHLLVTPLHKDSLPRALQSLGRRYVRHVNGAYRTHRPSLWHWAGPNRARLMIN